MKREAVAISEALRKEIVRRLGEALGEDLLTVVGRRGPIGRVLRTSSRQPAPFG